MQHRLYFLILFFLSAPFLRAAIPQVIPQPMKMRVAEGFFKISPTSSICTDKESQLTSEYLAEKLRKTTGYPLPIVLTAPQKNDIQITTKDFDPKLGSEGYDLTVTADRIQIRAPQQAGAFYGVQTLLQLLPIEVYAEKKSEKVDWKVPQVEISDKPRFGYRGLLLDVARCFFNADDIKRYLNLMAIYKYNKFHMHLTDDCAWRLEIKKYPILTEKGAWRDAINLGFKKEDSKEHRADGQYGGFYTQDQMRDLLAYAARLHIEIIPTIEMPGHAGTAISFFPQFACNSYDKKFPMGIFCPAKAPAYRFLEDVLTEVIDLFPTTLMMTGGDEVFIHGKIPWHTCDLCQGLMKSEGLESEGQLQDYFGKKIESFIVSKKRRMFMWGEKEERNHKVNYDKSTVMIDWLGGGARFARNGYDVVMAPAEPSYCYFDYRQCMDFKSEPLGVGDPKDFPKGFPQGLIIPLKKVYEFNPIPEGLEPEFHHHILGAQGCLWSEKIANNKHLDYKTFPRACALGEVLWSPEDSRDWNSFRSRMDVHQKILDQFGVNYRNMELDYPRSGEKK